MEDIILKRYFINIIKNCLEYIGNNVEDISIMFVYISFEVNPYFNVYFSNGIKTVKKNKLNEISKTYIDTSREAQSNLSDICLDELFELRNEKKINNTYNLPVQIKITHSIDTKASSFEISYTDQILDKTNTLNVDLAEKWFAELGGELLPHSLYRMKQLFGDDFLEKK
ncbi:hypothetical protein [uncultured Cytophaga sp.]|uniref:hypothetical protein n=1 Tax=uncultured Cytophaga sp. TaxID=160238 RepID=UPI00260B84D9|nr:hypothetical protein [uncultured Cytophaga sp.]